VQKPAVQAHVCDELSQSLHAASGLPRAKCAQRAARELGEQCTCLCVCWADVRGMTLLIRDICNGLFQGEAKRRFPACGQRHH